MRMVLVSLIITCVVRFPAIAAPSPGGEVPASVSQEVIPLSSPVYEDMDSLYLLAGAGVPSGSRPWAKTEAALILSRVERDSLAGTVLALYDSIAAAVRPGLRFRLDDGLEEGLEDGFAFDVTLDAFLEAYTHANGAYDEEGDWIHGFEGRRPMARLGLAMSLSDFWHVYCDLQYGRNRFNYQDDYFVATDRYPAGMGAEIAPTDTQALLVGSSPIYGAAFLTNVLEHSYDFDYQWPKRAVASVGGANWNLSLARDRLSWGNGHSGNFIVDDHVDYQDYARLALFSDHFKYDWLNVFFDTNTLPGEQPDTRFKLLMAHRLEFRITGGPTFAISENLMYENAVFDFRYINPAFIYHNLNNLSMFNAIAHIEIDWGFARGWKVYGQAVIDQARAPNETDAQSSALGWLGGIEVAVPAGPGILSSSLEAALTDPVLYRRERVDFLMMRKYYTNGYPGPGNLISLDYIGYPYGGDALVLQWDGAWKVPGTGRLGLRLFGMRHGAMDFFLSHNKDGINSGYANYAGSTPSGDLVGETLVASLSGDLTLPKPLPWLASSAWFRLDWVGKRQYRKVTGGYEGGSQDLQLTMGCSLSL